MVLFVLSLKEMCTMWDTESLRAMNERAGRSSTSRESSLLPHQRRLLDVYRGLTDEEIDLLLTPDGQSKVRQLVQRLRRK
jgi:hypothetical protein